MSEHFKIHFNAPKGHRFNTPEHFAIAKELLIESGFVGPDGLWEADDITIDSAYDNFGLDDGLFWFEDSISCGSDTEQQLITFTTAYSKRFPKLKFRCVRVGDEGRIAEDLKAGKVLKRSQEAI